MPKAVDITNQRFGRLVAMRPTNRRHRHARILWLCRCDCGRTKTAGTGNLKNGCVTSCGATACKRLYVHGQCHTPEYRSWRSMLTRCTNPNYDGYSRYGGRGITICEHWIKNFAAFLQDMGPKPSP